MTTPTAVEEAFDLLRLVDETLAFVAKERSVLELQVRRGELDEAELPDLEGMRVEALRAAFASEDVDDDETGKAMARAELLFALRKEICETDRPPVDGARSKVVLDFSAYTAGRF